MPDPCCLRAQAALAIGGGLAVGWVKADTYRSVRRVCIGAVMAKPGDHATGGAHLPGAGRRAPEASGKRPSPLLDLLPVRLLREAFRAYPGAFTGMREEGVRRRARLKLRGVADGLDGTSFAGRCGEVLQADRAAGRQRPHAWIGQVLAAVAEALEDHPFSAANWPIRAEALTLLDFPLHVIGGRTWRGEVGRFYQRFMARALDEIDRPIRGGQLRVWQMYNMGYVVKTKGLCVAFDLHPGVKMCPPLSGRQLRRLARRLDVAVVSHPHYDHQYRGFVRRMLQEGKTVVLPGRPEPGGDPPNVVRSRDCRLATRRVGPVGLRAYAGWQRGFIRNFVHVIQIDGYRIAHTGDNTRVGICEELVGEDGLDLALVNCWAGYNHLVRRARPRLILPGHVNELGHIVSMRCDYGFTLRDLARQHLRPYDPSDNTGQGTACAVLSWGEGLTVPQPLTAPTV